MEIVTSVAAKIAELAVEPIVMEVKYLVCYRKNLEELKDIAEELQRTKENIDREVEAKRANGRQIQDGVLNWQKSVTMTLEKANELCEDRNDASVWCLEWYFPNLISRYQHGRKAKKMANSIVEMKGKGKFDEGVGYVPPLDIINNFVSPRGSDELGSRNSAKEVVIMSLKDPKVNKIGVYGIGGVGKTTLIKEVAKEAKQLFDAVVMVTVSQKNLEKIQDEIAQQLGLHLEQMETTLIGRANRLCERIKIQKTLIVLDDLWEKIDLEKLGIPSSSDTWRKMNLEKVGVPLKDGYKGCKLLFTSRSQNILQENDVQKSIRLQLLNHEESWSLFEVMVGDVLKDDNFREIATQVAQRCFGLPVLIATTARSLKHNKDIYYWQDTLNNLKRVDNSRDINKTLFSALEFNLNRLEDEVKKVLLLCGMHGTSILVSDLLKYSIGLGIFQNVSTIKNARIKLHRIIIDLKAACLLVDDDARAEEIKMHDLVHEVAISMVSKYVFTKSNAELLDWPSKDILERCTHIILNCCCIEKLPEILYCSCLIFLHIDCTDNQSLEIPDSFFERTRNLEALDLTGFTVASLPISFTSLTKLKTLCLDQCSLKDMNGIGALKNLEILSLIYSSVEEFPSEIEQLSKLRMLDLTRSGIQATFPNTLCKLTKIEELYMGDAKINWGMESSIRQKRNASLVNLGHLTSLTILEIQIRGTWLLPKDVPFDRLERYKVVIGDQWEWSDNKETLRLLKLKLDTEIRLERGIRTLIKRVEDLYLDKISGISNVLFELNSEGFPLLKNLHVQNNGEIQHIVNTMERNQNHVLFPELETLILHNLNNLVKICYGQVWGNSFAKLKVVKVKNCDQLEYLFSISMIKFFSRLVEIEVSECTSMKKIVFAESTVSGQANDENIELLSLHSLTLKNLLAIDDFCSNELRSSQGRDNISKPFFSAKVKFTNLETLKLNSVNLKKIWDESYAADLVQNLANLTIEDCRGLKYLFSSSMVGKLSNLKQLEISKCSMMEEIIATEEISCITPGEAVFPKLEEIIIKDMHKLKTIWNLILASNSLASFKTLKVKNCKQIRQIFPEYMNGAFTNLETLMVEDCKSVHAIFELGVNADGTTQLKYITLLRLPQLNQIWRTGSQVSLRFKNLQVMRVEDCGHLKYLLPFSIAKNLPQLEEITIKDAGKMKEIVSLRGVPLDNPVKFEFIKLTSMVLWNSENLQGFCAGNHSLSFPSLKVLDVSACEKLKLFKTSSQGRNSVGTLHDSMQPPLVTLEEVIGNLEELTLSNDDVRIILEGQFSGDEFSKLEILSLEKFEDGQINFPYRLIQNMTNLEHLLVEWSSFKEIFPEEVPVDLEGKIENTARIKKLSLGLLPELQHICKEGCRIDPILEVLEYLDVYQCSSLELLVPSSVTFKFMTYLEVLYCEGLVYLIAPSTAKSLVKLITLKIRECWSVEQIVKEVGGEGVNEIEFKSLKVLELESLPELKMFCSVSSCCLRLPMLEKLVIRECEKMESFSMSNTSTPFLREIETDEDKKWFCEGDLNSTVNKIFEDKWQKTLCNMEHLELSQYPKLGGDVWYSHVKQGTFGNLKTFVVHKCDSLSKVLLPFNLLKVLPNLEELEVSECNSLETLVELPNMNEATIMDRESIHLKKINISFLPELKYLWGSENSGESASYDTQGLKETTEEGSLGRVILPNLETLMIKEMQNLKMVWHPILCPNSMGNFKNLEINKCGKVENICPSYMQTAFISLETLTVTECSSVKEIFQLGMDDEECATKLKKITLLQLPQLQQIWSMDSQTSLRFSNLEVVRVEHCNALEHLLPFNIAMDLHQLEEIRIKYAKKMKEIVSEKGVPLDCPPKFEFNRLKSLLVWESPKLHVFFPKDYTLVCPSLKILDVRACLKWGLFKKPFLLNEVLSKLEKLALNHEDASILVQEQFTGEQFHKLKALILSGFEDEHATFPYWLLQNNINNLESMLVETSSFKEIFIPGGQNRIQARIEKLILNQLHELLDICEEGFQIGPTLENIECLWVQYCSKLKHLVPSSVRFSHLTYLEVHNCNGLLFLITSSTASSLVKLSTLKIRACNSLEQVMPEGNKESLNEIAFSSLEVLELESLPRLKVFCSCNCILKLPLLTILIAVQCPRMRSFSMSNTSAPKLQQILTGKQDGKWCWEGDLDRTVDKIFKDKVAYRSFNRLEFSEYPELEELWYGQLGQKIFCNLKCLVIRKCTFLANMLFSSNQLQLLYVLEELEVAECDSLEVVFEVKAISDDKDMEPKEVSQLKKLTLSGLPNLKRIWNREVEEIISFGSLQIVEVKKCPNLKYLFSSPSLCQDLRHLEKLWIESCGVELIVSIDEGILEELKFDFPLLTTLVLLNLAQLTNFYPERHTLECPSLKFLNIRGCEELQIFAFDHFLSQPLREGDNELQTTQGAMFYIEKVCQSLEELPLNEKDSMRILNGNYGKNLFQSIKRLRLQYFQKTPIKFLNEYIQIFPSMTTLQVRCSSFKTLFSSEEIVHCNIAKIETLWLFQLEQLKQIWSDDESTAHPLIQSLENFYVQECSGIIRLAPPFASFKNLTSLKVEDCNGLMTFMTSFTAKSLFHLRNFTVCNCEMLEEIVMRDEAESQEEITFQSLEYLKLNYLSGFKSFCSGKHTFIFPSLVTLEVVGCPKMQNFSSGVIIAPFLKLVEVENGKKRWVQDLNVTIKQLFMDKTIEGVDEIVDSRKQEIQKVLNIPHIGVVTPKICEIGESSQDQSDQSTLSLTKDDAALGTQGTASPYIVQDTEKIDSDMSNQEMYKTSEKAALVPVDQNVLSPSMVHNIAIYPSSSQALETVTSSSIQVGGTESQKICEIGETPPNQTSQNTSSLDKVDADETIETTLVQVALRGTISPSIVKEPDSENKDQKITYEASDLVAQNILISVKKPMVQSTKIDGGGAECKKICEIIEMPVNQASQNTLSPQKVDADIGTEEMNETPFSKAVDTLTHTSVQKTALGMEDEPSIVVETGKFHSEIKNQETKYEVLDQAAQNASTKIDGEDIGTTEEMHETMLPPSLEVQVIAAGTHVRHDSVRATPSSTARVSEIDNKEGESDETSNLKAQIESMKELASVQESLALILRDKAQGSMISSSGEVQVHENIQRLLVQNVDDDMLIPASPVQDKEESHYSDVDLSKNLFNNSSGNNEKIIFAAVGTQETYGFKRRSSLPDAQNVLSPTTVYNTGKLHESEIISENFSSQVTNSEIDESKATIDPSPSKASSSSTTPIADFCSNFKNLDISVQLLPYLEAGANQHPQVLNWLNSKPRRVVSASSYFSLFAEVIRILRTTRKGHFTEENQNYIRECCGVLQGVGFDESWISYVHGCIEEHEDDEDLNKRIKEAEDEASNLKAQIESMKKELTFMKESLPLLHDKAQGTNSPSIAEKTEKLDPVASNVASVGRSLVQSTEIDDADKHGCLDNGTQEMYETIQIQLVENVEDMLIPSSSSVQGKAAPSQASNETPSSSRTVVSDFHNTFKELAILVQLLPYLEAGVNQHPQVLDWLKTKPRRVVASYSFSLFAEVTRILNTTQRGDFSEDDRNYIKECCTILQGAGFDESWISYVNGCIEEHEDGNDLNKREVEEVEDRASNLKTLSSHLVGGFSWRSVCKNIFIFITIYLLVCVLIYGLSKLPF